MRKYRILLVSGFIVLAACSLGFAGTWNEVGDAGDLPATHQITYGNGPLTAITGNLPIDADVDLYCIHISDPLVFQAQIYGAQLSDPDLWLFDSAGYGITHNDTVQYGYTGLTGTYVPGPGTYLIGISGSYRYATSGSGAIWATPQAFAERAPDGPGAGSPIVSWTGAGVVDPYFSAYTIYLTGADFCQLAVPEPGDLLALGAGLFGFCGWLRRRK